MEKETEEQYAESWQAIHAAAGGVYGWLEVTKPDPADSPHTVAAKKYIRAGATTPSTFAPGQWVAGDDR